MKKISFPEPKAVKEVHAWRRKIQKKAEKIGWDKYLKQINSRAAAWLEKPAVVRERPGKKYGSH
jgi:hypothetical protein